MKVLAFIVVIVAPKCCSGERVNVAECTRLEPVQHLRGKTSALPRKQLGTNLTALFRYANGILRSLSGGWLPRSIQNSAYST